MAAYVGSGVCCGLGGVLGTMVQVVFGLAETALVGL